ncbi:MAG: secondary thiamine-phosphate synthase enzyme YjbQ [Endomicrobiia bacterium]|nr:secondary thiamine-phosphate synthase enzyme YjbQ [Endomicrobiia bacterium]
MKIISKIFEFKTSGNCDIVDLTDITRRALSDTSLKDGQLTVFAPGATCAVTTMEYESGLIADTKEIFRRLAAERGPWRHDAASPTGNAPSHLRAALVGPSLSVPFSDGNLELGTWQSIVFIDFDNRPRSRKVILKFIGE